MELSLLLYDEPVPRYSDGLCAAVPLTVLSELDEVPDVPTAEGLL